MRRLRAKYLFTIIILLTLPLISVLPEVQAISNVIISYRGSTPTVNGMWDSADEWVDASEYRITSPAGVSFYIHTKHDSNYIYFLLDFVDDLTRSEPTKANVLGDYAGISIDTLHDKASYPKSDDFVFSCSLVGGTGVHTMISQGTGEGWKIIDTPSGWGKWADLGFNRHGCPHAPGRDHMHYEFRIPFDFLTKHDTYGLFVWLIDSADKPERVDVFFPASSTQENQDNPSTWETLEISPDIIPEFPYATIVLVLALLIAFPFLRRSRSYAANVTNFLSGTSRKYEQP